MVVIYLQCNWRIQSIYLDDWMTKRKKSPKTDREKKKGRESEKEECEWVRHTWISIKNSEIIGKQSSQICRQTQQMCICFHRVELWSCRRCGHERRHSHLLQFLDEQDLCLCISVFAVYVERINKLSSNQNYTNFELVENQKYVAMKTCRFLVLLKFIM